MRVKCLVCGTGVFGNSWAVAVIVECCVGEDPVALAKTYDDGHQVEWAGSELDCSGWLVKRVPDLEWETAEVIQSEQFKQIPAQAKYIIKDSNGVHILNDSYDSEEEAWADVDKVIRYREHGDYKIFVVKV